MCRYDTRSLGPIPCTTTIKRGRWRDFDNSGTENAAIIALVEFESLLLDLDVDDEFVRVVVGFQAPDAVHDEVDEGF